MKQTRIALWALALCTFVLLSSGSAFFVHPAFASRLAAAGSPTPTVRSDTQIKSLTPNMNCPQPPTNVDHATLSNSELAKYGLPRYHKWGKGKAAWQALVRASKHHVCGGTPLNRKSSFASGHSATQHFTPQTPSPTCNPHNLDTSSSAIWSGNITVNAATDGNCTQNNQYTEADTIFYVPCVTQAVFGLESSWVGLGGFGNNNLVQTGTESDATFDGGGNFHASYFAWTDNTAASNPNQVWLFNVNCGDQMFVQAFHSNETYILDYTSGNYNDTQNGPPASYDTAEWIVERTSECVLSWCTPEPLADFQSETFYGLGTTLGSSDYCSGCYLSPADVDHDYSNMNGRTRIGPLAPDPTFGPPDYSNTITWVGQ